MSSNSISSNNPNQTFNYVDYIPVISALANICILIAKPILSMLSNSLDEGSLTQYVRLKTITRIFISSIPVLGNIFYLFVDLILNSENSEEIDTDATPSNQLTPRQSLNNLVMPDTTCIGNSEAENSPPLSPFLGNNHPEDPSNLIQTQNPIENSDVNVLQDPAVKTASDLVADNGLELESIDYKNQNWDIVKAAVEKNPLALQYAKSFNQKFEQLFFEFAEKNSQRLTAALEVTKILYKIRYDRLDLLTKNLSEQEFSSFLQDRAKYAERLIELKNYLCIEVTPSLKQDEDLFGELLGVALYAYMRNPDSINHLAPPIIDAIKSMNLRTCS